MKNYMNLKTLSLLTIFALAITFNACNKAHEAKQTITNTANGAQIFSKILLGDQETDYTVLVTSSYGLSVFAQNNTQNISTAIQGYSKTFTNAGNLSINNLNIPFDVNSGAYYFPSNTEHPASEFQNQLINCKLNNGTAFGFAVKTNSQIIFSIDNLTNNKITRNQDVKISWTKNGNATAATENVILIEGLNETTNNTISEYFMVRDIDEQATISNSVIAKFATCTDVTISVARGDSKVITQNNKSIEFQDINFSWSTVFFH